MASSFNLKTIFLAAGLGQRLKPLTNVLPKCLMPINGIPLLEYWLAEMYKLEIRDILVNVHYRSSDVINFLSRPRFSNWVKYIKEDNLLGTAGTVRANIDFLEDSSCLLVHADNWCCCDLKQFIDFHINNTHWPAFNLSDTYITIGAFIYLFSIFSSEKFNNV